MGQCMSCLKSQTSADITDTADRSKHKDEMTEVAITAPVYPPDEPLLHSNEETASTKKNTPQSIVLSSSEPYSRDVNVTRCGPPGDKNLKPFYQKLPSIPLGMSTPGGGETTVSEAKINQLFEQYKDSLEDSILAEGIENLCNDLQLSPDDFKVLVLAWKLDAGQMCRFTRAEFVEGLKGMGADSIKGIQERLADISAGLCVQSEEFRALYRFTFRFGLEAGGARALPADVAAVLWRLVFTPAPPALLPRWLAWLAAGPRRAVSRDTWNMFLNFCEAVQDDLTAYDDTEAWPSLFDDFVEYETERLRRERAAGDAGDEARD